MSQITGGEISFGDGAEPIEYQSAKTAKATFSFSVGEGENPDAIIEDAMSRARSKVAELLGAKPVVAKPPAPKVVEPKKAPADAAVIDNLTIPAALDQRKPDAAAIEEDPLVSAPKEITDVELTQAIGRKNAEVKPDGTPAIKKLIAAYAPQDGKIHQAAEIEQAKRPAFLLELAKITKGG